MNFLIVDDHQLFAEGLQFVIEGTIEGAACELAYSAIEGLERLDSGKQFHLVLLDLNMPRMDGISFIRAAIDRRIMTPIVVLSSVEDLQLVRAVIDAGAKGFIPKALGSTDVIAAINKVLDGGIYLEVHVWGQSWVNASDEHHQRLRVYGITSRQYEVLTLMRSGQTNKQIARTLGISPDTVKFHVKALLKALHAGNRTECIEKATHHQLFSPESGDRSVPV
jgi:DNA-binding NarL/FixJ family response regulator